MESGPAGENGTTPDGQGIQTSVILDGDDGDIARARHLATAFLTRAQVEHGLLVSQRAVDLTQLVVSELVTNARKCATGPALLDLAVAGDTVEIAVWDSAPVLPVARAADAGRLGQHGLEIVMSVAQAFELRREAVGKRVIARLALAEDPSDLFTGHQPM
ncbi:ATP-binding protein [Streptomyces sp. cmx-4-7]|uniref:ATP-binding protein n=1 Tax=unclassified Streptomyces TaxID=2593676 RepID=UPI00398022FA